tara:strand:+ start:1023 stop:1631 length:609 start_codon:yes stop_codon:yes gene_type:complete
MKTKIKRIIIIAAILVIGLFGYNYWINTPQYSLLQIQKSVENKDRLLFEKHVDSQKIIEEIVDDISEMFIDEVDNGQSNEYSLLNPAFWASGLTSILKPTIESVIEEAFDDFWEHEIENFDSYESSSEFGNIVSSFEMSYIKKDGKVAKLGLVAIDPLTSDEVNLEFKLNKIENYWRITEISNLEELLKSRMDDVGELIDFD